MGDRGDNGAGMSYTGRGTRSLSVESCDIRWESEINQLLDQTQSLVATIETAAVDSIDGLKGNYVARITNTLRNGLF